MPGRKQHQVPPLSFGEPPPPFFFFFFKTIGVLCVLRVFNGNGSGYLQSGLYLVGKRFFAFSVFGLKNGSVVFSLKSLALNVLMSLYISVRIINIERNNDLRTLFHCQLSMGISSCAHTGKPPKESYVRPFSHQAWPRRYRGTDSHPAGPDEQKKTAVVWATATASRRVRQKKKRAVSCILAASPVSSQQKPTANRCPPPAASRYILTETDPPRLHDYSLCA